MLCPIINIEEKKITVCPPCWLLQNYNIVIKSNTFDALCITFTAFGNT